MRAAPALAVLLASSAALAQDAPPAPASAAEIVPERWLLLDGPDLRARRPVSPSAVVARHLLDRAAPPPKDGEEISGERRAGVKWTPAAAKDGVLSPGSAAWAYAEVESDADRVVLLRAQGVAVVWIDGEPFVGDVYGYGFRGVPARLRKGTNRVFLQGMRGDVRVAFAPAEVGVLPAGWDLTRPDDGGAVAVTILNASAAAATPSVGEAGAARVVRMLPLGVTKVPVMRPGAEVRVTAGETTRSLRLGPHAVALGQPQLVTRVSEIDGSVQEYAVVEPAPSLAAAPVRVVLSLHGASVPCMNQARAYSRRPGVWIVCPTNRRPFGFDWQDWGRLDAYEALGHFGEERGLDVSRVFLTGHSMGGHGTWHLAANDPDRFAAIAPSAGWISFDTYGGPRPLSALAAVWRAADGGSETLALLRNLVPIPAYVLHGAKDTNVPVGQAETILGALRAAGASPAHHFEPEADHWWDDAATPGAECVDWPAIFALFERTDPAAPAPPSFEWTTADLSLDCRHRWVTVLRAERYGEPVAASGSWDPHGLGAVVTTRNAQRINVSPPGALADWKLTIDGQEMVVPDRTAWLDRGVAGWVPATPREGAKSPERCGPLKRAFARRFALVLPTRGTPEETRETEARARFDAAQWWYRANGFADFVLDTEVVADAPRFEGRNLVLYGNADTNAAWEQVLGTERPVDVRRGEVRVGARRFATASAACFFVRPRADDADAVAAALADTGPAGCRLAMGHSVFVSGAGYPDYLAWDERSLALGDGGVLAAGFFDAGWNLDGRGFLAPEPEPANPGTTEEK